MNRLHRLIAVLAVSCATAAVQAAAPEDTSASAAVATHQGNRYDGTLSVDDATPTVGRRIFLKGHIRAAAPHTQAVLQVLYDNRSSWKDVGRDRANRVGHYVFAQEVTTERTREYRVVEAHGDGQPRRQSKVVTVVPHA